MKISKKALAELYDAAERIERLVDSLTEEESIPCPIQMAKSSRYGGDGLSIPFPDGRRCLYYNYLDYMVSGFDKQYLVDCVLIPCKREDLKPGDTAFRTSLTVEDEDFNELFYYCKIKNNNRYACIDDGSTADLDIDYEYWYKVVQK